MKLTMKNAMIVLTVILLIAVVLFWRDVWSIFAGMSVLEAMNTIVTFILHVAVATIAAYAAMLIPEYIKPWMQALRWKQRQTRKARRHGRMPEQTIKAPRMNTNAVLMALLRSQMGSSTPRPPQIKKRFGEGAGNEEPTIRLDL